MIKHVGKHNGKKIILLFRQVPEEHHMCLVLYSDSLPQLIHDNVMRVLESAVGQQSKDLADALFRHTMDDGNNTLTTLHKSKLIKKVPTNQVIITPNSKTSIYLDKLNTLLNEIESGADAKQQYAELENQTTASPVMNQDVGEPQTSPMSSPAVSPVLSNQDLAQQHRIQAQRLRADAAALLAQADSLITQAQELDSKIPVPQTKPKSRAKVKKS